MLIFKPILMGGLWGTGRVLLFTAEPPTTQVSLEQLTNAAADLAHANDAGAAQQLAALDLTERIDISQLGKLLATMPGEKSRTALTLVADKAAFLAPPPRSIGQDTTPDAAATRAMLTKVVNYVNTTNCQLPNLIAERATTGFEDRPSEDAQEEARW